MRHSQESVRRLRRSRLRTLQAVDHAAFEQTRYLFPLLAFYSSSWLSAPTGPARGPRRSAPSSSCSAIGHSLFSMLLVVSHYYA